MNDSGSGVIGNLAIKGGSFAIDPLSFDNEVFYNEVQELLRLIDLVEFYLKDQSIHSYISIYTTWFIYLAFINIGSYSQFIGQFLKKKPVVSETEAHLIGNYLIFEKLQYQTTLWKEFVIKWATENSILSGNKKFTCYATEIENEF